MLKCINCQGEWEKGLFVTIENKITIRDNVEICPECYQDNKMIGTSQVIELVKIK